MRRVVSVVLLKDPRLIGIYCLFGIPHQITNLLCAMTFGEKFNQL